MRHQWVKKKNIYRKTLRNVRLSAYLLQMGSSKAMEPHIMYETYMADILEKTFSDGFCWMKIVTF